jgi:hypothetical protein
VAGPPIGTVAGERSTHGSGDQTQQDIWQHLISAHGIDGPSDIFTARYARRTAIYSPFEFQLNLAFAKAYLIESKGTRVGLTGARFFIHQSVFDFFTGLPFQDGMGMPGGLVSTVVDVDDAVVPGYRYVRIGPPARQIQRVKQESDVDISIPVGYPPMVMLLDAIRLPLTVSRSGVLSILLPIRTFLL